MGPLPDRVLLHAAPGMRLALDLADVFFLEAVGGRTRIRLRGARAIFDTRNLGEMEPQFTSRGFVRIHRNHVVNVRRIRWIRRRADGQEWEVKLTPPVNRVLPIARSELQALWRAFGA